MKITFFLAALHSGGGERVLLDLADRFSKEGHEVDLVLIQKIGSFQNQIGKQINIVELKSKKISLSIFPFIQYLKREKPDIVITISFREHLVSLVAKIISRSKARFVVRIGIPLSILFSRFTKLQDRFAVHVAPFIYKKADLLIANSTGIAEDASTVLTIPIESFHVIYNPKDIKKLETRAREKVDHEWLQEKKVPVVIAVGRLREQKGFDVLLDAFSQITQDARLIIVGEGGELHALKGQAEELNISDKVDFIGFKENPHAYMALSDLFVLSSRWEGFPNVLIEAMALKVPVIATDCRYGPKEILQTQYGTLVPIEDPELLAKAMERHLSDLQMSRDFSEKAYVRVQDFATEEIISQYKELLRIK